MTIIRQQIQAATAVAVAWTISEGDSIDITRLHLVFASAPTTAGNITLTVVSAAGATYNTVIQVINPVGKTDISISDICGLSNGDSLLVSYANADTISIVGVANVELTQSFGRGVSVGEVQLDGVKEQTQMAGYDPSSGSTKFTDNDPLDQRFDNESLVDTTDESAATHYYPAETGAVHDGKKLLSQTIKVIDGDGDVTITLEGTNDEDASGGDWHDVTTILGCDASNKPEYRNTTGNFSYAVSNGTLTVALAVKIFPYRRYRWVFIFSGATNTAIAKNRVVW